MREFTSVALKQRTQTNGIRHVYKVALNDLNTTDRALGLLKVRIRVVVVDTGGTWLDALQMAADTRNPLDTEALLGNSPEDVLGDQELVFRLRQESAKERRENVQYMQTVGEERKKTMSSGQPICL